MTKIIYVTYGLQVPEDYTTADIQDKLNHTVVLMDYIPKSKHGNIPEGEHLGFLEEWHDEY